MVKVKYFIVLNPIGLERYSEPFETEPTLEDIENFWKETWKSCTIDGSEDADKLYPNVPLLSHGYAEVKKQYYWSQ